MAGTSITGTDADFYVRQYRYWAGFSAQEVKYYADANAFVGGDYVGARDFDMYRAWIEFKTEMPTHCTLTNVELNVYCEVFAVDADMTPVLDLAASIGTTDNAFITPGIKPWWTKKPGDWDGGTTTYIADTNGWYTFPANTLGTGINLGGHTYFRLSRLQESTPDTTGRWQLCSANSPSYKPFLEGTKIWSVGDADNPPGMGRGEVVRIPACGGGMGGPARGAGAVSRKHQPAGAVVGAPRTFWR